MRCVAHQLAFPMCHAPITGLEATPLAPARRVRVAIISKELQMLSLPADLDALCFSLFVRCDEFDSASLLRAVFTTTDLAPFADSLPDKTGNKKAFVTQVKSFLLEKRLADGRVLLLPFLDTLRGRYSEQDVLRGELNDLYQRVLVLTQPQPTSPAGQSRESRQSPTPPGMSPDTKITPVRLLTFLNAHFSESELRALCFELEVDFENLEGTTKNGKAMALIQFCQRRGRFEELAAHAQQARPDMTL